MSTTVSPIISATPRDEMKAKSKLIDENSSRSVSRVSCPTSVFRIAPYIKEPDRYPILPETCKKL